MKKFFQKQRLIALFSAITMMLLMLPGMLQAQITVTTPASRCGEGPLVLTATGAGTIKWYSVPFYGTVVYTGSSFTTTSLSVTTTYYVDAVDGANCSLNSNQARVPVIATVNASSIQAAIFYSSNTFCKSIEGAQTVTRTGTAGGHFTYTGTGGTLTIDEHSGAITPSSSTNGTYTVTYTVTAAEGCTENPASTDVTITNAPLQSAISYTGSPFCTTLTSATVNLTNPNSGTYSASPSGLSINASDGTINPSLSLPGGYTVTYFVSGNGGCEPQTKTTTIAITGLPTATLAYPGSPFCKDITSATPSVTGTGAYTGGSYSFTGTESGLGSFSTSTGIFNPSTSTAGNYTIKYTAPASANCAAVETTTSVRINPLPTASISGGTTLCAGATAPKITFTGLTGTAPFTFTYKVNNGGDKYVTTSSGSSVDVAQETASAGTFTYALHSVTDGHGCTQAVSGTPTQTITINGTPVATFAYPLALYCTTGTAEPGYIDGGVAGAFTSTTGLSIAGGTGIINVALSTSGTYTVKNTVSSCGSPIEATTEVTINHVNPNITGGDEAACGTTTLTAHSDATSATYIWYKYDGDTYGVISNETSATLAVTTTGSYKVQVTNTDTGCSETSAAKTLTINTLPACSITGSGTVTYGTSNNYTATAEMSSYIWSITGGGEITAGAGTGTITVHTTSATPYTLTLTINDGHCSSVCDKTVYVDKAVLTATAAAKSKAYGAANPTLTFAYSGWQNGDDATDLTTEPTASTTVDLTSPVAVYTNGITLAGGVAGNYSFTYVPANLTVTKAVLTVTAADKSKAYNGSVYSPFTYGITGFANGETEAALRTAEALSGAVTYSGTATSAVNAGNYSISPVVSALTATNYTFAATNGSLEITKVVLTVTAPNKSKAYDKSVYSPFTYGMTGFANSETEAALRTASALSGAVTYSGDATTAVNAGTWTITPVVSALTATNYTFTPASGSLEITKVSLTVTAANKSKTVDGSVFTPFTSVIAGYVTGDDIGYVNGLPVTYTGAATTATAVGVYNSITPVVTGLSATNYSFTPVTGTLTIKPVNPDAAYGGATCEGLSLSLTASSVTGATAYSWTGPSSFTSNDQNPTVSASATTAMAGIYYVTVTVNGATSDAGPVSVSVSAVTATPVISTITTLDATHDTVTGTGEAGATIIVYNTNPSPPAGSTTADESGNWTVNISKPASGDVITAKAQATGKCISAASNSKTVPAAPSGSASQSFCSGN